MFIVWFMIWISNGVFPKYYISAYIRIPFFIITCLCYYFGLKRKKNLMVNKKLVILTFFMIILQSITVMLNGLDIINDIYLFFVTISSLLFVSLIDKDEFIISYTKALRSITIISIIIYIVGFIFPLLLKNIPSLFLYTIKKNDTYVLMGTFLLRIKSALTYYRNCAIFSEPGQFQIFLSVGLIIELFLKEKINMKNIIILIIGYFTCMSTNGFITCALIFIAYALKNDNNNVIKKRKKNIIIIFIIIVLIVVVKTPKLNSILDEVENKIDNFSEDYSYNKNGTGMERRRAVDISTNIFLKNPIFGVGYKGMKKYVDDVNKNGIIMTFSPMNWFARFGILYGIIANLGLVVFFIKNKKISTCNICLFFAIMTMISAQAVNADLFIIILILYGWNDIYKEECK